MIQTQEFQIKTKNTWGDSTSNVFGITEVEKDTIVKWLESNQTPFNGFAGKVFFMKDVTFPRYKFTDYGRNNNNIVQTTRTTAYADAVVINVKEWISILNNRFTKRVLQHIGVTVDEKNEYIQFPNGTDLTSAPNLNTYITAATYGNFTTVLETIVQAYNEFAGTKIINVFELNSVINNQNGPLTSDVTQQLTQLLKSNDSETVKLGMEMITNYDLEASLLHLMLISNECSNNMRYNNYWSSTNFKSFRDKFRQITHDYFENYMNHGTSRIVSEFLTNPKSLLLEEDFNYVNTLVTEEIKSTFKMEEDGYILTDFNFKLNINENQIIRKPQIVEQIEEVINS